jgi:uncharacterized protein YjhX (UPF0386 family)
MLSLLEAPVLEEFHLVLTSGGGDRHGHLNLAIKDSLRQGWETIDKAGARFRKLRNVVVHLRQRGPYRVYIDACRGLGEVREGSDEEQWEKTVRRLLPRLSESGRLKVGFQREPRPRRDRAAV